MRKIILGFHLLAFFVFVAPHQFLIAEEAAPEDQTQYQSDLKDENSEYGQKDTFLDPEEALQSKHYVRRAILSSMIKTSTNQNLNRIYVGHLMGFNAVYQRRAIYMKYMSGVQGLSVGYLTDWGHALEGGIEFSTISSAYAAYRYYYRPESFSIWPFVGLGLGKELRSIRFSEGPEDHEGYNGQLTSFFGALGLLIPLVDVAFKAEIRFTAYGNDRYVLTQGIGAVLFL